MSEFVIESSSLWKRFGRKVALQNLSLEIPRGGVHALVGCNGAGKSTLFRILLGFLHPSAGTSRILGADCATLSPEVRGRIGFVNEEHTLPGWMTAEGLEAMSRDLYPTFQKKIYREVAGSFQVPSRQKVSQLSRGERAGLNLSLALARRPELLMLDEPTLGLDLVAKQTFLEALLFAGEDDSGTVIFCSHQMDEVERTADNLIVLERGALLSMSPPEELVSRLCGWRVDTWPRDVDHSSVPGLLRMRDLEGQTHLITLDPPADFAEVLAGLGARGITPTPLSFDRALNAFLSRDPS